MSAPKPRRPPPSPGSPNDGCNRLSKLLSSDEGYRLLSTVSSEEYKLLQDTKEILEERFRLDKKYAQDLQVLTAKADRIVWPTDTHSIASACHELLMQWSHEATMIESNVDQFRHTILDDLIKNLLEQKADSKKFLEDQKRQCESEHRKSEIDVADAEKRYLNEAKLYVEKNAELKKVADKARICDDNRIADMKRSVIEKRDNVYCAHNEYVLAVREYNFIDEQYVRKVRNLLVYHEEAQVILNRQWQKILEAIANYMNNDRRNSYPTSESLQQIFSINPSHCYDEICKTHSNIPSLTTKPIVFNDLLLQTSGLPNLKANKIIVDDTTINNSTINVLRQKVRILTDNVNEGNDNLTSILQVINQMRDKETSYYERKRLFEQEQRAENLRMKIAWEENLKNDLQEVFDDSGIVDDDSTEPDLSPSLSDRLEDQTYFHGLMPRAQSISLLSEKGDYLIRINDRDEIILSILWTDSTDPNKLNDRHFVIHEKDNMYSFQINGLAKETIPKLITYYSRQSLELRDDGTRLIRPVEKPNHIINNDEVKLLGPLGKGNFGEVTRGEYRNVPVAVKTLHSTTKNLSLKDQDNFINEALLLKRLKHERIVHFIGIAAYREPLMIVTELVEQGSLSSYLRANKIRTSQLTQMCYEIAKGMAYLESCNVIHRDLAARNCLVDKNGRIKVADFGLSRLLQDDEEYFSQTKVFPVRWWAVEALSKGPYTNKSDVWSYGITIWEIFSKAIVPYAHIGPNHLVINAVKRDMPHLLVSTKIRLESGPTILGDERSDPELMEYLGGQLFHEKCNNYSEYRTEDCIRIVLDKLEARGYRVISMTGIGQTCIWLSYKD